MRIFFQLKEPSIHLDRRPQILIVDNLGFCLAAIWADLFAFWISDFEGYTFF